MKKILLCLLLGLPITVSAQYVLDPNGLDSNNCTTQPCYSINRVQQLLNNNQAATVTINDGTYYLNSGPNAGPISLTKSGASPSLPITYQAAQNARPVFTGAAKLPGPWLPGGTACGSAPANSCYYTTIPQGFVNFDYLIYVPSPGKLADAVLTNSRRTQSTSTVIPTGTYQRSIGPVIKSQTDNCIDYDHMTGNCLDRVLVNSGDLPNLAYALRDIKYYNFSYWNVDLLRISGTVPNYGTNETELQFAPGKANGVAGFLQGGRYMIVNSREYFRHNGTPGTFYLDCGGTACVDLLNVGGATLYYIAQQNESPASDSVYVPQLLQLVTTQDVNNVTFNGIAFVGDNYVTPTDGYTSITGQPAIPAALSFVDTQAVTITSSVIAHTAGWGLEFTNPAMCEQPACIATSASNSLTNSVLFDIGTMGLRLGRYPPDPNDNGNSILTATNSSTVDNNLFSGVGRMYPNGATGCIWIGSAHDNSITNNECADNYGAGISVGPAVTFLRAFDYNNSVKHNNFHDLGQGVLMDFGCVHFANMGGAGFGGTDIFKANICHDMTQADGDLGQVAHGIYIDNNSQNVQVTYNLVYRSTGALFFNNASPSCPTTGCNNLVSNNIFAYGAHPTTGGEPGQGAIKRGGDPITGGDLMLDFTFSHNIVYLDLLNEYPQWVPDGGIHNWDCPAGADCSLYFKFRSNGYFNKLYLTSSYLKFYTNRGSLMDPWTFMTWMTPSHPNEDLPDSGTTTYGNPNFISPGCSGSDNYRFQNNNLTSPIGFDANGFTTTFSTYTAGRNNPALCNPSSMCSAAPTFPTFKLLCSQW